MIIRSIVGQIARRRRLVLQRNWKATIPRNQNVLAVAVKHPFLGFFAHMNVLINILRAAEEVGATPRVRFISSNYVDRSHGADWLRYFFDVLDHVPGEPRVEIEVETHRDMGLSPADDISLYDANALIFRHIRIKEHVERMVDRFSDGNGLGSRTLGVHYRGTDKVAEAPRVAYADILDNVEMKIGTGLFDNVFIASDEEAFIICAKERLGTVPIVSYPFRRSVDNKPLHLSDRGDGAYEMGLSALVDCLTLARCGALVRTCSLLSSWASVFSPNIQVTVVNASYSDRSWWPERVIAEAAERSGAIHA